MIKAYSAVKALELNDNRDFSFLELIQTNDAMSAHLRVMFFIYLDTVEKLGLKYLETLQCIQLIVKTIARN